MKILFCNYEYPPLGGGGGVINAMLAEELAKTHEVAVLTSAGLGLSEHEVVDGVRIIRVPVYSRKEQAAANFTSMAAFMINGVRAGKKLLAEESFDIINTHFALPSGPVGHLLSKNFSIPNVLSVHGGDLYDPSKFTSPHRHWLLRTWVRNLLQKADVVVGQSRNTLDNVAKYYDASLPTRLIPLGIHRPPAVVSAGREALGFTDDEFLLVTMGRLVSRKGLDRLLHIVAGLQLANVRLVVIGSGPLEGELKDLAAQLGLEATVSFQGFVSEEKKLQLLEVSDLYVSSSQHEGFGLVFLEAMAMSLPVICYDHGGQTDFLEHGKTGGLLTLNDEEAFATNVRQYCQDENSRTTTGEFNKHRVEDYFIDTCASQYEALFSEFVESRSV